MAVSTLCKTLIVQFGEHTVHFVHLSETISGRSRLSTLLFLQRRCMAVSGVCAGTNSYQSTIQSNFKQRQQDFQSLADALQAGNLQGAQQAVAALQQDRASSSSVTGVTGTQQ